jgi:hypothetical protein
MGRAEWPVVVGGCHRSGTSLVRRLLDAHPAIHCGPEVPFFRDFYGDYIDDPLRHLRFATSARALLAEEELMELLGAAFVALHERAAAQAGKRRWADKAPENVLYTEGWERVLRGRWLLIHVVRNPLDTLASMKEARFPLTLPADHDGKIALYRRYTEAGLEFGERHPDRCRRVVYEELCEQPGDTLEGLMNWLGESFDPCQLAFNKQPRGEGLEDPKIGATAGVHRASVGKWSSILSAAEAATVWERLRGTWARVDQAGHWVSVQNPHDR